MSQIDDKGNRLGRKGAVIVPTKGPKNTKVGDVVEAEGALSIVSRIG